MSLAIYAIRHVSVETRDQRGDVLYAIKGEDATYEQSEILMKDEYKKLIGDANARTSVSVSSKMGGAYGYSAVSINVSVTLTCNQDRKTLKAAKDACLNECVSFIDEAMPHCMAMLDAQLHELYRSE